MAARRRSRLSSGEPTFSLKAENPWSRAFFVSSVTFSSSSGGDEWNYTFTATMTDNNSGYVTFNTALSAGAYLFTGSSLQVKGSSGSGTVQFAKPSPSGGTPDLKLTKTGATQATRGQTITYSLTYQNLATGAGNTCVDGPIPASRARPKSTTRG